MSGIEADEKSDMDEAEAAAFALFYTGRHHPDDARWWLDYPHLTSPRGTHPVQQELLLAVDDLEHDGLTAAASALREAVGHVLASDRRNALHALRRARDYLGIDQTLPND